jgi:hypothetical protein
VADHLEIRIIGEGGYVELPAREKIIHADDLVAIRKEPFAKMGAEEARTPRDKNAHTRGTLP